MGMAALGAVMTTTGGICREEILTMNWNLIDHPFAAKVSYFVFLCHHRSSIHG